MASSGLKSEGDLEEIEKMTENMIDDLDKLYDLLERLECKVGGKRTLGDCTGRMEWPERGVYFFFENGEYRTKGNKPRVVRVGTHAVRKGSETKLWQRLRQHRGTLKGKYPDGGNHRGSVYRKHVGHAIIKRNNLEIPSWGVEIDSSAREETRDREYSMEKKVSKIIRKMPFLWVKVPDPPGKRSDRKYIERNAVALLSNYGRTDEQKIDEPSDGWLGNYSPSEKVRQSGLWNENHVMDEAYDPNFLNILSNYIGKV